MPPTIDGLTDLALIGRGGFGTVYRARQVDLGRLVAVKVLPDVQADSESWARFLRECRALGALDSHPNIATVYASGAASDGSGYLTMELLPGGSLADRVAGGPSPWAEVATWGVALAGALETAHRAGITHRDVKPENVLFDGLGSPKLVDFGIASVPGAFRTATGAVTLTLAHAAPEVVAGGRGGVAGDVYSLGSTLFAALAGRAAFVAPADETMVPMLARIAGAPVPDLRPDGVPDRVCAAIERAMAKDPAARPASAEAFGMALHEALAEEGVVTAPPPLLLPGLIATAGAIDLEPPRQSAVPGGATLTGWDASTAARPTAPAAAEAPAAAAAPSRRINPWAVVSALAIVALGVVGWRGIDAASSAGASAGPSASATPSPSSSASRSASSSASASTSKTPAPSPTSSGGTASTSPPAPSPTPKPTAPVLAPGLPRTVAAVAVVPSGGTQVAVTTTWAAPSSGAAVTAYEVRCVSAGGGGTVARTTVDATTRTARLTVPVPTTGHYTWQVRSRAGGQVSAWVAAGVRVPDLVGTLAVLARPAARALGLAVTTTRTTGVPADQVGRVLQQSLAAGSSVPSGARITLSVGAKA